jgi:predicted nucleotidyltransferase
MDVVAQNFLTDGERAFFVALNDLGVRYLIVGMSAALLQGARGATEDIDLWFESIADERIGHAARAAGGFWVTRMQPPMLGGAIGERVDVVTLVSGLPDFAMEYANAIEDEIDGVAVKLLPLARIIVSKRTANRAKDIAAIVSLETALRIIEETSKK